MDMNNDRRDQHLWASLRKGREEALSELFMLYSDELYNYGYMLCRDKQLVEDSLQDVFLHLWRKRKTLSEVKKVKTYLMVSLRNRIKDAFRKATLVDFVKDHLEGEAEVKDASQEDRWVEADRQHLQNQFLRQALSTLPERMRQAIFLRYFHGFEYADIAEIMNIRPQVAINMVYRATQKLRAYSERYSEWLFLFILISLLI